MKDELIFDSRTHSQPRTEQQQAGNNALLVSLSATPREEGKGLRAETVCVRDGLHPREPGERIVQPLKSPGVLDLPNPLQIPPAISAEGVSLRTERKDAGEGGLLGNEKPDSQTGANLEADVRGKRRRVRQLPVVLQ